MSLVAVLFLLAAVSAPVLAFDGSDQGAEEIAVASPHGDGDKEHGHDKDDDKKDG